MSRRSRFTLGGMVAPLLLAGCASGPPQASWLGSAARAQERATEAYLSGDERVAQAELAKARAETARTGKAVEMARVELTHCAARVASLVLQPCAAFEPLAVDAGAAERAYAAYLAGQHPLDSDQIAQLPAHHRPVALATTAGQAEAAVAAIEDPLARTVAAGVLLRTGRLTPATARAARDSASEQGWRRPLLAWLGVLARLAQDAGDQPETERLRRWMERVAPG